MPLLKRFHVTELEDRMYWHVRIKSDGLKITMTGKAGETAPDVTKFLLKKIALCNEVIQLVKPHL